MYTNNLKLDLHTRDELWRMVRSAVEDEVLVAQPLNADGQVSVSDVRQLLKAFDFDSALAPTEALATAIDALDRLQPQVRHPRHFGYFDPAPTTMGVIADALVAAYNPCLASWEGSPFGVETERLLLESFGRRFGYDAHTVDGVFTSGGSEANFTALLMALAARFPQHRTEGVVSLPQRPVIYTTSQAHASVRKAVMSAGLGSDALRDVPVDHELKMDMAALERMIVLDRDRDRVPLMMIMTVGATASGVVDPIRAAQDLAARYGLWFHADAAWGGAAILLPELEAEFEGIEHADSITFDPHKWLFVPKNCGMLLTRHKGLLDDVFAGDEAFLDPSPELPPDPARRSFRWSRDFSSLKLLLSLAVAGWSGYESIIREQTRLGDLLREQLRATDWSIVNSTVFPVVCFRSRGEADEQFHRQVAQRVNASGELKLFTVRLGSDLALRACITNYETTDKDIDLLVDLLNRARDSVQD